MAVFKLTASTLLIRDLDFKLLPQSLLVLAHLLHSQSQSLLRFNRFSGRFALIRVPPLMEIVRKALKVLNQCLYLGVCPITLILQLLYLLIDQLDLKVELVLQLEQLMRNRSIMFRCAFLLALTEELLRHYD